MMTRSQGLQGWKWWCIHTLGAKTVTEIDESAADSNALITPTAIPDAQSQLPFQRERWQTSKLKPGCVAWSRRRTSQQPSSQLYNPNHAQVGEEMEQIRLRHMESSALRNKLALTRFEFRTLHSNMRQNIKVN
ncbi:hypothetical protein MCOR02_006808 [Pyricularia oryzae]|nr:hypothetical protein MCOR02_006808 [Pyricularia oryzae]KAI6426612.1 hypothetical protein MCOR22_010800 [Pyricularia oryzae]KAI6466681.1 hypothetical protein MCOR15_002873 [Pyricularia oryzae]KAI6509330.1 hypothetical protein MCOR13_001689 [Pyricularia oryzae]KAI6631532.1 hypothetical protein MCOR14_007760 [Pyricularia oryzae]